jgi:hypothetical protein
MSSLSTLSGLKYRDNQIPGLQLAMLASDLGYDILAFQASIFHRKI